jgi:hypothetical protein
MAVRWKLGQKRPRYIAEGNCMGENLILLSCGAAFITGLVITAASLFG